MSQDQDHVTGTTWWERHHSHVYGVVGVLVGVAGIALTLALTLNSDSPESSQLTALMQQYERDAALELERLLDSPPLVISQPSANRKSVDSLPELNIKDFSVVQESIIFDLRRWVPVPSLRRQQPVSPGVMHSRVRLKKKVETDAYHIPAGTSGYDIYFHSESHPDRYAVLVNDKESKMGKYPVKERVLEVDVSDAPVGKEFDIETTRTYWNAFQNEDQSWVGTIVRQPPNDIRFLILFPSGRPFTDFKCWVAKVRGDDRVPCTGRQVVIEDPNKNFIYWKIINPRPNHSYQIDWEW